MPGDRFELEVEPKWNSSSTRAYLDEVKGLLASLDDGEAAQDPGAGVLRADLQNALQNMERLLAMAKELGTLGTKQGAFVQQATSRLQAAVGPAAQPTLTPGDTRRVKDATNQQAKAAERDAAASTRLADAKTREAVRIGTLSALQGRVAGAQIPVRNENYKSANFTGREVSEAIRSRLGELVTKFPDLSKVVDGVNLNTSLRNAGEFDPVSQHLSLNPAILEQDARQVQQLLGQYRNLEAGGARDTPKGSPERQELARIVTELRAIAQNSIPRSRLVSSGGDFKSYIQDVLTHEIGHVAQDANLISSSPENRAGLASRFDRLTGTRYGTRPDEAVAEGFTATQGQGATGVRALREVLRRQVAAVELDIRGTQELTAAKAPAALKWKSLGKGGRISEDGEWLIEPHGTRGPGGAEYNISRRVPREEVRDPRDGRGYIDSDTARRLQVENYDDARTLRNRLQDYGQNAGSHKNADDYYATYGGELGLNNAKSQVEEQRQKEAQVRNAAATEKDTRATVELSHTKERSAQAVRAFPGILGRALDVAGSGQRHVRKSNEEIDEADRIARQRKAIESGDFQTGGGRGDEGGGQPPPPPPTPPAGGPPDEPGGPGDEIRKRLRRLLAQIDKLEADARTIAPGAAGAKGEADAARRLAQIRAEADSLRRQARERASRGEIPSSLNEEVKDATKVRGINNQILAAANERLKSDKAKNDRSARIKDQSAAEEIKINDAKRQEAQTSEQRASQERQQTKEKEQNKVQQAAADEAELEARIRRAVALPDATVLSTRFPQIPGAGRFNEPDIGVNTERVLSGEISDTEKTYLNAVASGVEAAEERAKATVKGLAYEQSITEEQKKLAGLLAAESANRKAIEALTAARRSQVLGTPQIEGAGRAQTTQNARIAQQSFLDEQDRLQATDPNNGVDLEASNNVREARRKVAVALAEEGKYTADDAKETARLALARGRRANQEQAEAERAKAGNAAYLKSTVDLKNAQQKRALEEAKALNASGYAQAAGLTQDEQAQTRRQQQLAFLGAQGARPVAETIGADAEIKLAEQRARLATELAVQQGITSADIAAQVQLTTIKKLHAAEEERILGADANYIKATAELNAAMKIRAQKEKEATANAVRASIQAGTSGGVGQGGSLFQRAQAALAQRQGKVAIPEDYQKLGQFVGSKALTTGGFFLSGAVLYGGLSALQNMVEESGQLEINFKQIQAEFESFGEGSQFSAFRDDITSIAQETGVSTNEVAKVALQFKGAFGDTERAARETESAIKLSTVAGLDLREITDQVTASAIAYGVTIEEIGDKSLALQERTGVLAKETIGFIAAIAEVGKQSGLSLDQLGAIGAVAQQTSGRAGTALAENFGRVLPTIQEKAPELIQLYDTAPSLGGKKKDELIDLLGQGKTGQVFVNLIRDFKNLSNAEQSFVLDSVIGRREAQSLIGVLNNYPRYLSAIAVQQDAAGKTGKYFAEVQGTVSNAMARLQQAFRQIGETLLRAGLTDGLQAFLGVLRTITAIGGGAVNFLGALNNAFGGAPVKILALLVAMRELSRLMQFIGGLKPFGGFTGGGIRGFGQAALAPARGIGRYLDPRVAGDVAAEATDTTRRGPLSRAARRVTGVSAVQESSVAAGEQISAAGSTLSARVVAAANEFYAIVTRASAASAAGTKLPGGLVVPPGGGAGYVPAPTSGLPEYGPPAPVASTAATVGRFAAFRAGAAGILQAAAPAVGLTLAFAELQAFMNRREDVKKKIEDYQKKLEELDAAQLNKEIRKLKGNNDRLSDEKGVKGEFVKSADEAIPILGDIDEFFGLRDSETKQDRAKKQRDKNKFLALYAPIIDALKQDQNKKLRNQFREIAKQFDVDLSDKDFIEFLNNALIDPTGGDAAKVGEIISSTKPIGGSKISDALVAKLNDPGANAKTIVRDILASKNKALKEKLRQFAERQGLDLDQLEDAVNGRGGFDKTDIQGKGGADAVLRRFATDATKNTGLYNRVSKVAGLSPEVLKAAKDADSKKLLTDVNQLVSDFQSGEGSANEALDAIETRLKADRSLIAAARRHPGLLPQDKLKALIAEAATLSKQYSDITDARISGQIDFATQLGAIGGATGPDVGQQLRLYGEAAVDPKVSRSKRLEYYKQYIEAAQKQQALDLARATSPEDLQAALSQKLDPQKLKSYTVDSLKQFNVGGLSRQLRPLLEKAFGEAGDPVADIVGVAQESNISLQTAAQEFFDKKEADLQSKIAGEGDKPKKQKRDKALLKRFKELEEIFVLLFPDLTLPTEIQSGFDTFSQITNQNRDLTIAKNNVRDPIARASIALGAAQTIYNQAQVSFAKSNNPEDLSKLKQAEIDYYNARNDYAEQVRADALAAYDVLAALANQNNDPIGAAQAELAKATQTFNDQPTNTNRAALIAAQTNLRNTTYDRLAAEASSYIDVLISETDDPVKRAQYEVSRAQSALDAAKAKGDIVGIRQAQAAYNNAIQAYFDANAEALDAISTYNIAQANLHGDPIKAAQEALKQAQRAAQRHPNDKRAAAAVVDAEAALYDAQLSEIESDIEFDLEMGKISRAQAIKILEAQLALAISLKKGKKVTQDLQRRIKALRDGADQDATFDVPANVKLPTLYEARRLASAGSFDAYDLRASGPQPASSHLAGLQASVGDASGGALGTVYNDNKSVSIQITVEKEVDGEKFVEQVVDAINAPARLGTAGRAY